MESGIKQKLEGLEKRGGKGKRKEGEVGVPLCLCYILIQ